MNFKQRLLKYWNLWPPFLLSGIKVQEASKDYRHIVVRLKLRFWNANFFGTQYGGLLYSMTDPFYMIMLHQNLGPDFIIWDKSAHIKYIKPGRTDVTAEFTISEEDLDAIRKDLETVPSLQWNRKIEIRDLNGEKIAEVDKYISIKKKKNNSEEQK